MDNEEIDELYPSVTVELRDYCPEFGEFARAVLGQLATIVRWQMLV